MEGTCSLLKLLRRSNSTLNMNIAELTGNTATSAEWILQARKKTWQVRDGNTEGLSKNVSYP